MGVHWPDPRARRRPLPWWVGAVVALASIALAAWLAIALAISSEPCTPSAITCATSTTRNAP